MSFSPEAANSIYDALDKLTPCAELLGLISFFIGRKSCIGVLTEKRLNAGFSDTKIKTLSGCDSPPDRNDKERFMLSLGVMGLTSLQ